MRDEMQRVAAKLGFASATVSNALGIYDIVGCMRPRAPKAVLAAVSLTLSSKLSEKRIATTEFAANVLLERKYTPRHICMYELAVFKDIGYNAALVPECLGMRCTEPFTFRVGLKRSVGSPRNAMADSSDSESDNGPEPQPIVTRTMREVASGLLPDYAGKLEAFLNNFHKMSADTLAIRNMEQRGAAWINARSHRITGSVAGSWMGYNPFSNLRSAIKQRLHNTRTPPNAHMKRGVRLEPIAVEKFREYLQAQMPDSTIEIEEAGLCVMDQPEYHCFGYSPDMVIRVDGVYYLGEIKAPNGKFYASTPLMYKAQMQMGMWMLRHVYKATNEFQACHFVQILEHEDGTHELKCEVEPYDKPFAEHMMTELKRLWEDEYVPRVLLKKAGHIKTPSIDITVDCDPDTPLTISGLRMYKKPRFQ